jgi:hypothetical protein
VVSCLLLTNDVVTDVPFHVTTELLLKLLPFTVRTKPSPPAVAVLGESELTEGVDGQEQQTAGSRKSANAPKRSDFLVVAISAFPANQRTSGVPRYSIREDHSKEHVMRLIRRIDMIIIPTESAGVVWVFACTTPDQGPHENHRALDSEAPETSQLFDGWGGTDLIFSPKAGCRASSEIVPSLKFAGSAAFHGNTGKPGSGPLLHHYVESGRETIISVSHDNGIGSLSCGAVVLAGLRRRAAVCA